MVIEWLTLTQPDAICGDFAGGYAASLQIGSSRVFYKHQHLPYRDHHRPKTDTSGSCLQSCVQWSGPALQWRLLCGSSSMLQGSLLVTSTRLRIAIHLGEMLALRTCHRSDSQPSVMRTTRTVRRSTAICLPLTVFHLLPPTMFPRSDANVISCLGSPALSLHLTPIQPRNL